MESTCFPGSVTFRFSCVKGGVRSVVQRVSQASVKVEGATVGEIGPGFLVLLAVAADDADEDLAWLAGKIVQQKLLRDGVTPAGANRGRA